MPDYMPHTEDELAQMLAFLGLSSLDELFASVPAALRLGRGLALDEGSPEPDVLARMESLGRRQSGPHRPPGLLRRRGCL